MKEYATADIRNVALIGHGSVGKTQLLETLLHATGAMEPLLSALKYFRDEFEQHITEGRCPYNSSDNSKNGAQHG